MGRVHGRAALGLDQGSDDEILGMSAEVVRKQKKTQTTAKDWTEEVNSEPKIERGKVKTEGRVAAQTTRRAREGARTRR